MGGVDEADDNLRILATHGFSCEGIYQASRPGPATLRMDCPEHDKTLCLDDPERCAFFLGFRRNTGGKKFIVLCGSAKR